MGDSSNHDVTGLLARWKDGDEAALQQLVPIVHEELRRLARAQMAGERPGHTLQPTALVNEAYLRLVDLNRMQWQNRVHFFSMAARLMRHPGDGVGPFDGPGERSTDGRLDGADYWRPAPPVHGSVCAQRGGGRWSPDGRRLVYQTSSAGDPMFVQDPEQRTNRQILVSNSGVHNHFPVWSPDGAFIYFVRGFPPDQCETESIMTLDDAQESPQRSARCATTPA